MTTPTPIIEALERIAELQIPRGVSSDPIAQATAYSCALGDAKGLAYQALASLKSPLIDLDPNGGADRDREPSMALSVLDDFAVKDGWADARTRFHANDIALICNAMVAYGDERCSTPTGPARSEGREEAEPLNHQDLYRFMDALKLSEKTDIANALGFDPVPLKGERDFDRWKRFWLWVSDNGKKPDLAAAIRASLPPELACSSVKIHARNPSYLKRNNHGRI